MTQTLLVEILPALSDNYIYLLHAPHLQQTIVVDPGEAEPVLSKLKEKNWSLTAIWNTHHHGDHTHGNLELKRATGCRLLASAYDCKRIAEVDEGLKDGDKLHWAGEEVVILATPGHTLGAICFWLPKAQMLFSGDTLFAMGCGRLFEGSPQQMWQSLARLKQLPGETRLYCGHEYTLANGHFALSLEADNPRLQARLEEVKTLRAQGRPSLPATMADECLTNPFLRADEPQWQKLLDLPEAQAWQVFAELRRRKDQF